jgi:hypothetical protein
VESNPVALRAMVGRVLGLLCILVPSGRQSVC